MVYKFDVTITPFGLDRTVHLYLPQGYEQSDGRYPVLYFYDGHNLFSDADATYGKSWGLGDYLDRCGKGFIAVGVECNHEGNGRLIEYYPFGENLRFYLAYLGRSYRFTPKSRELAPARDYSATRLSLGFIYHIPLF